MMTNPFDRLSWKARGLLAYLLSHPEGQSTSVMDLVRAGPDGRESVRGGIAELEAAGYLIRERVRAPGGRLVGMDYVLVDPGGEGTHDLP